MADEQRPEVPLGQTTTNPSERTTWRRRIIRGIRRLIIALVIFIVFSGIMIVLAEHHTSKPEFCGSCHIMEPYYESWHADLHGGKLEVACIECHYAPGERATVKAKLRGLSQVASYVSGRYGASRPRAHVENLSCLTSKCHGDMKFMDKEIRLGTVTFTHAKHLRFDAAKRLATQQELQSLTQSLQQQLSNDRFAELEAVSAQAVPVKARTDQMTKLANEWKTQIDPRQLAKFTELQHRQVRIDQLADLQCTNCHSYVAPVSSKGPHRAAGKDVAHHFTAKTTACFVCHFNNQDFNTGTASCLTCHSLPTKEVTVHKELSPAESAKLQSPELAKQSVRMDHQQFVQRKVNCIACHADVATDDSKVTRRDCERCHNQPGYFLQWKEPLSLDMVKHFHKVHVPEQRAKCLDCHSEIQHRLVRETSPDGHAEFLTSAMANCTHCHPNHHADQIKLLSGKGGVGVPKGDANLMFGARTNCFGCHVEHASTDHGTVTRGSLSGCIACHGDRHSETFEKWKKGLQVSLMDSTEAYNQARKMLAASENLDPELRRKAAALLDSAQADLRLVGRGNGVHNLMYSIELLDSVTRRSQEAMELLAAKSQGDKR